MQNSHVFRSAGTWLEAARPKTLTAAIVPVLVGTTLSQALFFTPRWDLAAFAVFSALFIQIGTNLINDAVDFKKGTDTHGRIGPRRVTQSGLLSANSVMRGGFACFFLAMLCAVPLLIQGGLPILAIGVASLVCGYAYTAGPLPLAYVGAGDLFVIVFFGLVAVGGVFFLNTGQLGWIPIVAGAQIGLLACVLIAINNLRDAKGDAVAKKLTLAVRFGKTFSRLEIAALCLIPFALNLYWLGLGFYRAAFLPMLSLPLAFTVIYQVFRHEPSPKYNSFLALAALLHLSFGILLSVGFLYSGLFPAE